MYGLIVSTMILRQVVENLLGFLFVFFYNKTKMIKQKMMKHIFNLIKNIYSVIYRRDISYTDSIANVVLKMISYSDTIAKAIANCL